MTKGVGGSACARVCMCLRASDQCSIYTSQGVGGRARERNKHTHSRTLTRTHTHGLQLQTETGQSESEGEEGWGAEGGGVETEKKVIRGQYE